MLPLPIFDHHRPRTLDEARALLDTLGDRAVLLAGGTDLLPNIKQGLVAPEHVVSIGRIPELSGISLSEGALCLGAGVKLCEVAESLLVQRAAPALAQAAASVGGPQHRAMGTLGGNLCLDTRCRYYNQTYFWRKALGFCLKKDGTVCHVVKGGARCVAAASNDTAPALMALGAELDLLGRAGHRRVAVRDFYVADGVKNTLLEPGELVVRVLVPLVPRRRSGFAKLRKRGAIDFPLLSVAARVDLGADGALVAADGVVSALGARPRALRGATSLGPATKLEDLAQVLAAAAYAECKPLSNLDDEVAWRRDMVPILMKKAVRKALEGASF